MVTVKKKSAAAIAGFVLFLQGPMPAWAQEAAEVVQNTQVQTEATVKASTEEAIEKAEEQVHQLEAQIEEYKKKVTEFDDLLNKISETEKIAENAENDKAKELLEAQNALKMDSEAAKAKVVEFEKSKKEKESNLTGLKAAYEFLKEQYDNAKLALDDLQNNEQEKSETKERAAANIKQYESQISNLHKEVDSLKESIASDSAQVQEHETKMTDLESALEKAVKENSGDIDSINNQLKKVSDDQNLLFKKIEGNRQSVAAKEETLKQLDTLFKTAQQEFEKADEELKKIKDQIDESKKDVAKKLEASNTKDSEVKKAESETKLLNNIIENYKSVGKGDELSQKIESLKRVIAGVKALKNNQPDARANNNKQKKQVEDSLRAAETKLEETRVKVAALKAQLEQEKAQKNQQNSSSPAGNNEAKESEKQAAPVAPESSDSKKDNKSQEHAAPVPAPPVASAPKAADPAPAVPEAKIPAPSAKAPAIPSAPVVPSVSVAPATPAVPAVQVEDNSAPAVSEAPSAPSVSSAPAANPTVANTQKAVTTVAEVSKKVSSAAASQVPAAVIQSDNTSQANKSAESQVSEENSTKPENNKGDVEEVDEKISDTVSEKPKTQASATSENKSSGNMLSTIMLGVFGALTISGAAAAGVTVMRHRRLPRA